MTTFSKRIFITACAALVAALFLSAQAASATSDGTKSNPVKAATTRVTPPPAPPLAHQGPYVIGPDDLLQIDVWKEPEISRTVSVRPDGKISLPLAGEVTASGLSTAELQAQLTEKLKNYIEAPSVTVILQEVRSKHFYILGSVAHPGVYPLAKSLTILDAIAMAGGVGTFAKPSHSYLLRRAGNIQYRIAFDYNAVVKGRKLKQNLELMNGDTIVVP